MKKFSLVFLMLVIFTSNSFAAEGHVTLTGVAQNVEQIVGGEGQEYYFGGSYNIGILYDYQEDTC